MPHHDSRIDALLRSTVVWDNHVCLPLRPDESFLPQLERYRRSGATMVSVNIGFADTPWHEHVRMLSFMRRWLAGRSHTYRLIRNIDDVDRCKREGTLGVVFDIEGMTPVQDNLALVQTFYELGVRWMLIAYNRNNAAGGGCLDVDSGLTSVGRAIIDEMERVGMVLCLSHAGERTALEALEYSRNPVIFSHSNPSADTPHPRNVSDALMRACARKGGVIGLSGIGPYVGDNRDVLAGLLRQLRHVIDLVGPRHVGLGLDYVFDRDELDEYVRQNAALFPADLGISGRVGMVEPEALGVIAEGLAAEARLSDEQIRGVLGENWVRIASQVWR